ncbi:uncharacterized protein RSE6_06345 [Rhynchosporium secalis]|uniref:Uncharacterized protein n=1 Tax=Rhynchosporium secalis TaxID=38038 RepID=A0A1E1MA46_RHYSE|nr:uncharacterized protein RSE6_06345 [Rhynchosporium secalis]
MCQERHIRWSCGHVQEKSEVVFCRPYAAHRVGTDPEKWAKIEDCPRHQNTGLYQYRDVMCEVCDPPSPSRISPYSASVSAPGPIFIPQRTHASATLHSSTTEPPPGSESFSFKCRLQ